MRGLGKIVVVALATAACVNEYHPEYHPETSYTFVREIRPTTQVTVVETASAPAPAPSAARGGRRFHVAPRDEPRSAGPVGDREPPRAAGAASAGPEPAGPSVVLPAPSLPAHGSFVASALGATLSSEISARHYGDDDHRRRCREGEAGACIDLPGIHLNGNVRIYGNVTMFGDVFVNDSTPAVAGD